MMDRIEQRRFYIGVFILCSALMMLQIIITRILSVMAHYNLVFFAISMAMFGMTLGASWIYRRRGRFRPEVLSREGPRGCAAGFAMSTGRCWSCW